MFTPDNGTSVPPAIDSPPRKSHVLAITLEFVGELTTIDENVWIARVMRRYRLPMSYCPTKTSAKRLTALVKEMNLRKYVNVSPELQGWTCYVDRAVYPPPKPEPEFHCPYCPPENHAPNEDGEPGFPFGAFCPFSIYSPSDVPDDCPLKPPTQVISYPEEMR